MWRNYLTVGVRVLTEGPYLCDRQHRRPGARPRRLPDPAPLRPLRAQLRSMAARPRGRLPAADLLHRLRDRRGRRDADGAICRRHDASPGCPADRERRLCDDQHADRAPRRRGARHRARADGRRRSARRAPSAARLGQRRDGASRRRLGAAQRERGAADLRRRRRRRADRHHGGEGRPRRPPSHRRLPRPAAQFLASLLDDRPLRSRRPSSPTSRAG